MITSPAKLIVLASLKGNLQINAPKIKTLAYFGLIRPLLEVIFFIYAATTWDPYTEINFGKIEVEQQQAARFVFKKNNITASVREILDQLSWDGNLFKAGGK